VALMPNLGWPAPGAHSTRTGSSDTARRRRKRHLVAPGSVTRCVETWKYRQVAGGSPARRRCGVSQARSEVRQVVKVAGWLSGGPEGRDLPGGTSP